MPSSTFFFEIVTLNAQGKEIKRDCTSAQQRVENLGEEVILEMVVIPSGTFWIGAPKAEEGWHASQSPQHQVSIKSFSLGKYPVTQAQWQMVTTFPKINRDLAPHPANFVGENRPVEQVSWYDAVEFCARLTQRTGRDYRLPSEAEWEYACRALTVTPFHFGETIVTDLANYSGIDWEYLGKICSKGSFGAGPQGDDRRETTPVGSFGVANQFGLYDMHGNVREWCADHWHSNYQGTAVDGTARIAQLDNYKRLLRGGSWNVGPAKCRSAYRTKLDPEACLYDVGFRVASEAEIEND